MGKAVGECFQIRGGVEQLGGLFGDERLQMLERRAAQVFFMLLARSLSSRVAGEQRSGFQIPCQRVAMFLALRKTQTAFPRWHREAREATHAGWSPGGPRCSR